MDDQSQACIASDARRVAVVSAKAAVCADDGLATWLSGLSETLSDDGIDSNESGVGRRHYVHSLAQLFWLPCSSVGCLLTTLCGLEVIQAHRYRAGFRGSGHGTGDTQDSARSDSPLRPWSAVCQHGLCGATPQRASSDQYVSCRQSV